ncbi:MAG: hypothetical protein LBP40_02830 [Campylobacteraceae bacterium]|nr:hypothetical protein [Campylobacteraceae bacterium]
MYKTLIFIDFENLQKIDKDLLASDVKIIVFVGVKQDKLVSGFLKDYINEKAPIEFIKPNVQGNNALDFCITFYVGYHIGKNKDLHIIIYSKDTDYDTLITYLQTKKINIERLECKSDIHQTIQQNIVKKQNNEADFEKSYNDIIEFLKTKHAKVLPRRIKTLEKYLQKTTSVKNISQNDTNQIIEKLKKENIIEITNDENGAIKFNIEKLEYTKDVPETTFDKKYHDVIKNLKNLEKAIPTKIKTLKKYLQNNFKKISINDNDIEQIVERLIKDGIIEITNKTSKRIKLNKDKINIYI